MKYPALILIVLLSLIFIGRPTAENAPTHAGPAPRSQPEIFSHKPKSNCIENIQIQQKSMVKELKKIKSILKKRKQQERQTRSK